MLALANGMFCGGEELAQWFWTKGKALNTLKLMEKSSPRAIKSSRRPEKTEK